MFITSPSSNQIMVETILEESKLQQTLHRKGNLESFRVEVPILASILSLQVKEFGIITPTPWCCSTKKIAA
ncbi:Uncharacterized protein TCM_040220 [Theobroma cacao]|uniref:Uncharacterized protein n=1 Tax=Theobroma cacao TaxID=3641 RepID=A0A061GT63_THECC|nr:Uncharacterized protein TCM_040220 [Theobroma cacao]